MSYPPIDLVHKTSVTRKIEEISRDPRNNYERRTNLLNALRGLNALSGDTQQAFVQLSIAHGLANGPAADMMRRYWFPSDWQDPNSRCWWREHQPIEPIIRRGLIRALEIAQDGNLPIDAYWVIGNEVAVAISWNDRQVTLLRITPPVPSRYILADDDPRLTQVDFIEIVRVQPAIVTKLMRSVP